LTSTPFHTRMGLCSGFESQDRSKTASIWPRRISPQEVCMANGVRRTGKRVGAVAAWTLAGAVCAGPQAKADVVWDTYGSGYHQGYLSDGANNRTDAQAFSLAAPALISEF